VQNREWLVTLDSVHRIELNFTLPVSRGLDVSRKSLLSKTQIIDLDDLRYKLPALRSLDTEPMLFAGYLALCGVLFSMPRQHPGVLRQ
jgi:hypothetical protein